MRTSIAEKSVISFTLKMNGINHNEKQNCVDILLGLSHFLKLMYFAVIIRTNSSRNIPPQHNGYATRPTVINVDCLNLV